MSLQRVQALPSSELRAGNGIPGAQPPASGPLGSGNRDQPIFRLNLLRALQLHRRMALGFALGGLLLGVIETLVVGYSDVLHIPSGYRDAVAFFLLILILLFKPTGLLGRVEREKV